MSHKNFISLDPQVIEAMCERYRTGASIADLMAEFGRGRNKIIRTLKEALGTEYTECVLKARQAVGQKVALKLRGRPNPHTSEWDAKIAAAHVGLRHTDETRALLSRRNKERELDPEWQSRKTEITQKIVEGKRARGYFKLHAQRHGALMRARERESQVMSKRAKAMWQRGACTYGDDGIKRSKLEKRVYAAILKLHPDARHTFPIHADERSYYYDIHVPSLNTIVEVNGDFWHCNPRSMSDEEWMQVRDVTSIRARDAEKHRVAVERGYRVITLWEMDLDDLENAVFNHLT
jgi:G:T-mismatch repair DNA endonuclease (very short patch repair protein)